MSHLDAGPNAPLVTGIMGRASTGKGKAPLWMYALQLPDAHLGF